LQSKDKYRQYKATQEIRPVGGKPPHTAESHGHNLVIIQSRQANSNDGNDNNNVQFMLNLL